MYPGVKARIVEAQTVELSFRDTGYMGVSADSVWAATNTGLIRIDPDDMSMVTVDDTPGFGMFATESSVWVSDYEPRRSHGSTRNRPRLASSPRSTATRTRSPSLAIASGCRAPRRNITRLNEPSGAVVAEVKVGNTGRSGPQGVTATADAVWVGIPNTEAVVRVDPATNKVVATIPVATSPCGGIAATDDAVWVSSCFDDEKIIRIDPRTNKVVGEFSIGGHNGGPVVVNGYPWFPVGNRLVRFNPATNEVDGVVEFSRRLPGVWDRRRFRLRLGRRHRRHHPGPRSTRRARELGDSVAATLPAQ